MNPITKTEVNEAISATEKWAGWSSLDMSPITITAGNLRALIEAAKCARYTRNPDRSPAGAYVFLDDSEQPYVTK